MGLTVRYSGGHTQVTVTAASNPFLSQEESICRLLFPSRFPFVFPDADLQCCPYMADAHQMEERECFKGKNLSCEKWSRRTRASHGPSSKRLYQSTSASNSYFDTPLQVHLLSLLVQSSAQTWVLLKSNKCVSTDIPEVWIFKNTAVDTLKGPLTRSLKRKRVKSSFWRVLLDVHI